METRIDAYLLNLKRRMLGVITQVEVAKALKVTPVHVNAVLNGRRDSRRIIQGIERMIAEREKDLPLAK